MKEVRVYFEGDHKLRSGFHVFLGEIRDSARAKRIKFNCVATGGRPAQFFAKASQTHTGSLNVLLLDSEGPDKPQLPGLPPDSVF